MVILVFVYYLPQLQSVARFRRPFESRPADPARRERLLHLITQPGTSGVIPATAAIASTPRPLDRAEGPSSAHRRGFQCLRRLKCKAFPLIDMP